MEKLRDHLDYYYIVKGYNCAETVFHAANDAWGLGLQDPVLSAWGALEAAWGPGTSAGRSVAA